MIDTLSLHPGSPIYIDTGYGFQHATVIKVLPKTGCVDVQRNSESMATRFRKDGTVQGGSRWDRTQLDLRMTFEERTKWMEMEVRKRQVVESIRKIKAGDLTPRWPLADLGEEIARLRVLLDVATEELGKIK